MAGVSFRSANGRVSVRKLRIVVPSGAFIANVTYRAVRSILLVFAPGNSGNLYVIAPDGTTILSLRTDTRPFADRKLSPATTQLLFSSEGRRPVTYSDFSGNEVFGTLKRVPNLDWAVVPVGRGAVPGLQRADRGRPRGSAARNECREPLPDRREVVVEQRTPLIAAVRP